LAPCSRAFVFGKRGLRDTSVNEGSKRLNPVSARGRRLRHPRSGDFSRRPDRARARRGARERTKVASRPGIDKKRQHGAGRKPRVPACGVPFPGGRDRRSRPPSEALA
jgi:hypothetical protein